MHNRLSAIGMAAILAGLFAAPVSATEKPIEEFPKDVKEFAFAWTEPIKSVAEEARHVDPIRALWFGLLKGSFRSVQRMARLFLPSRSETEEPRQGSEKLLEYTF